MRIMSFNVLCCSKRGITWESRIPLVVRTIRKYNPDSFGVQEATIGWMRALEACLPDYGWVGVGRDDGKEAGEFSAVFYRKNQFELKDSGTFWLSETPEKPGLGWDADCIRVCTYALLADNETGRQYVHFNTHLDHIGPVAQQKGAELVAARAKALWGDIPAVFTGDFNVEPDSAPCEAVKAGGFADTREIAAETDKGTTFHDFEKPGYEGQTIDYVFVRGDVPVSRFAVVRDRVDGDLPSDHYAVYADLAL